MRKRKRKDQTENQYKTEAPERDIFDETMYDAVVYDDPSCEEYPDLQYAAVSADTASANFK